MESKYYLLIGLGFVFILGGIFVVTSENEFISNLNLFTKLGMVSANLISLTEDSNIFIYDKDENTEITYYIKDGHDKIILTSESFLNETNKFGWVFNETNINSELSLTSYKFDKKIYYEMQSDKVYAQHSKYILSRDLGKTKLVKNEIGQWEEKKVKRFIDFSEVFKKDVNLYDYITTEELVCVLYNETDFEFECLKYELQNITRKYNRDINMKMYLLNKNWIIEFFNLFDLDPEFKDDTNSNWDLGTMINMEVEGTGAGANLTSNKTTGGFLSRIFDAGSSVDWKNITYSLEYPYGEELPANQVDEEWMNMTGNVLLMHFNNDSSIGENDTHVFDWSGNSNNGTVTEAIWTSSGKLGAGAFEFDGAGDRIVTSYGSGINPSTTPHTFSAWAKSIESGNDLEVVMVTIQGSNQRFYLAKFSAGWCIGIQDKGIGAGGVPVTTEWTHLTLVMNGSTATLYVNGVFNSGSSHQQKSYTSYTFFSDIWLGTYTDGSTYPFNGSIDEVAIWNRSLSADEIKNLYNRGAVKFNVSVRSCNDGVCSGESFRETTNNASFGRVELLTDSDNQYFQYMFNYTNSSSATVRVNDLSVGYEETGEPPVDSCDCPEPDNNWEIDLEDNCGLSEDCNIDDGNVTFINTGTWWCNATLTSNLFTIKDSVAVNEIYNLNGSCKINVG